MPFPRRCICLIFYKTSLSQRVNVCLFVCFLAVLEPFFYRKIVVSFDTERNNALFTRFDSYLTELNAGGDFT